MKGRLLLGLSAAFFVVMVAFVVMALWAKPAVNAKGGDAVTFVCKAGIEAGLWNGPDAPLDLSGDFELTVNSADLTFAGTLTLRKDGTQIAVTGSGNGRGIDLVFQTPDGKLLFAHGSMQYPLSDCKGVAGGPLSGPEYSDMGDWVTRPPFIRVISGTNALINPLA